MNRYHILLGIIILVGIATAFNGCDEGPPPEPFTLAWNYDTNGFLETCGCSSHQLGGLSHRATLIENLRGKQPLLAIEGAHFIESAGEFQFFKGETIVSILNLMSYDALQLGIREAQHGTVGLNRLVERAEFPCFSSNLTIDGEPWETPFAAFRIANNNVVIVGVSQPEAVNFELPAGIGFSNPRRALDVLLPELRDKCDVLILCLEGERTWIRDLVPYYENQVDLFLAGNRNKTTANVEFNAVPPALNNWDHGRYVGVVSVDPLPTGYQITATSVKVDEDYEAAAEIITYLDEVYRPQLKDRFFGAMKVDLEQIYLPPNACEPCHYEEYRAYTASSHGHALDTLFQVNQLYNPDCMSCHVVYDAKLDKLHSMNCVICHSNITDQHIWDAVEDKVVLPEEPVTAYTYESCAECHNEIQSNEFKALWPQYVNEIYHGGDRTAADEAAERMGIDIDEPPPAQK